MTWLDDLADKAVNGELPAREEALAVLASGDDELLDVVAAAFRVRSPRITGHSFSVRSCWRVLRWCGAWWIVPDGFGLTHAPLVGWF